MQIGFHLTPFWSVPGRTPTQAIDEAIEIASAADKLGYTWISIGHHWLSHPYVWPQPYPILAALARATTRMRLKTSMLLLPLLNAVEVAENVATLDYLSHGRLDLGVAIGYRKEELAAAGLTRADRAPKLEEAIAVMKRLWAGDEVSIDGRYVRVPGARLGFTPLQKPHPPIEMGAQSRGAVQRAARLADSVFLGPHVSWADLRGLGAAYKEELAAQGRRAAPLGASRCLIIGKDGEDAARRGRAYIEKTFGMYQRWEMQEQGMASLELSPAAPLDDWAVYGSASDCVEQLLRARDEAGLERVGLTIYSLPPSMEERIEYLQMIAEDIARKLL